ncbi:hypothetical protein [Paenibacillus sp. SYP-B4298]|uniref:hypothetical protein n=1 Tax=Paenibacillus sp. SYP-B4298 TaxID=2996034 RepID=UPI0022DD50ED|nr:hypothetical protein [Paenibacillus sp. SYP-B4298]
MNKKSLFSIIAGSVVLIFLIIAGLNLLIGSSDFIRQFQSFSLTVINQSDYDLISVETGIVQRDDSGNTVEGSKHLYSNVIESGQEVVIRPRLTINGEGGIYMVYIDSIGKEARKGVCSYTESASGYAIATITNDNIKVEEKCS